jgi:hypothetical protein
MFLGQRATPGLHSTPFFCNPETLSTFPSISPLNSTTMAQEICINCRLDLCRMSPEEYLQHLVECTPNAGEGIYSPNNGQKPTINSVNPASSSTASQPPNTSTTIPTIPTFEVQEYFAVGEPPPDHSPASPSESDWETASDLSSNADFDFVVVIPPDEKPQYGHGFLPKHFRGVEPNRLRAPPLARNCRLDVNDRTYRWLPKRMIDEEEKEKNERATKRVAFKEAETEGMSKDQLKAHIRRKAEMDTLKAQKKEKKRAEQLRVALDRNKRNKAWREKENRRRKEDEEEKAAETSSTALELPSSLLSILSPWTITSSTTFPPITPASSSLPSVTTRQEVAAPSSSLTPSNSVATPPEISATPSPRRMTAREEEAARLYGRVPSTSFTAPSSTNSISLPAQPWFRSMNKCTREEASRPRPAPPSTETAEDQIAAD